MNQEPRRLRVYRITVDEQLSDDLFRFLVCSLREGVERFIDRDDDWQEEKAKLVHPSDYTRTLRVRKAEAPLWETLKEGQVYLSGEFETFSDGKAIKHFKISPDTKGFLRIDNLKIIDEGVKALYSDALRRR